MGNRFETGATRHRPLPYGRGSDEVWVGDGNCGRIALKSCVKVYGGFADTERSASGDDSDAQGTYISGGGVSRPVEKVLPGGVLEPDSLDVAFPKRRRY